MGDFAKNNDIPLTYWIDRSARVVRADHCDPASGGHCHELQIIDGIVYPADPHLRADWFKSIKQVSEQGKGMLFVLSRPPDFVAVALAPDMTTRLVAVRAQRSMLCDLNGIAEFSRISNLTVREGQVLKLLCLGMSPKDIAIQLATAVSTVRSQIKAIFAKSGIKSIRDILVALSRLPSTNPAHLQGGELSLLAHKHYPLMSEGAIGDGPPQAADGYDENDQLRN